MKFNVNDTGFSGEMDTTDKVEIKSYNKTYDVVYNQKSLDTLIHENYEINDFIVIDRNVYNIDTNCLSKIDSKYYYIFDANEDNKNMESVLTIIDLLFHVKFNKKNKVLVIGGGITQDVVGFVCAIYKRGLKWLLIPTTLLSMTDSCIGGKVGVNRISKNMLALFYAPNRVIVSDYFLKSLKHDDIISGIGEALKLSLIGGGDTYQYFQKNYDTLNYINLIKMSTSIKKLVIEYDEFELLERKSLNYGHSFGHVIETLTNYQIPHGEAVLLGIQIINKLFTNSESISNIISNYTSLSKIKNINFHELVNRLSSDKKVTNGIISLVVVTKPGKTNFIDYKIDEFLLEKVYEIFAN
jgi:3-dehydroquinate synthase